MTAKRQHVFGASKNRKRQRVILILIFSILTFQTFWLYLIVTFPMQQCDQSAHRYLAHLLVGWCCSGQLHTLVLALVRQHRCEHRALGSWAACYHHHRSRPHQSHLVTVGWIWNVTLHTVESYEALFRIDGSTVAFGKYSYKMEWKLPKSKKLPVKSESALSWQYKNKFDFQETGAVMQICQQRWNGIWH